MSIDGILRLVKSEEGVSPVVGEILMVGIVVLMAAIVAAFVFGVVSIPEATPQAYIAVDDVELDEGGVEVKLLHESGSSLDAQDTSIIVTNLNDTDMMNLTSLSDWDGVGVEWSVGERIGYVIEFDEEFTDEMVDEIEIRVVHEPSGGTVSVLTS